MSANINHSIFQGEIKHAAISASASADLIALVSDCRIVVLAYTIVVAAAVTVKFQSGGSNDLTGAMSLAANGGISAPFNPAGHFMTAVGAKLNLVLGSSQAVAGHITYIVVP